MRPIMSIPTGLAARRHWNRAALSWVLDSYLYADPAPDMFAPPFCVALHTALVPLGRHWAGLRGLLDVGPPPVAQLDAARAQLDAILTALIRDHDATTLPRSEVRPRALPVAEAEWPIADGLSHAARAGSPALHDMAVGHTPADGPAPLCRIAIETPLALAITMSVLALAEQIPRTLVRRCRAFDGHSDDCLRVFVATKAQFCPRHREREARRLRQRAAERRFRERHRATTTRTTKKKRSPR